MTTLRLRSFTNLVSLRAIQPARLLALLRPHQKYLADRGLTVPDAGENRDLDYERLVAILADPDAGTPQPLLDALFLIDELANRGSMEQLLDSVPPEELGLSLGDCPSPADVVAEVWLRFPELLRGHHARHLAGRARPFEYFRAADDAGLDPAVPDSVMLRRIETELDGWFGARLWGVGTRLQVCEAGSELIVWIRRGRPIRREERIEGGVESVLCDHPIRYDLAIYDRTTRELRVNAPSRTQRELYRGLFGEALFGSADAFSRPMKYTLSPLRSAGRAALACGDVEGIERVRLVEVQLLVDGVQGELRTLRSSDLFGTLDERQRQLPADGHLVKAIFRVTFADDPRPRLTALRLPNVATYGRDGDAPIIDAFFRQRGFIRQLEVSDHAIAEQTLACA